MLNKLLLKRVQVTALGSQEREETPECTPSWPGHDPDSDPEPSLLSEPRISEPLNGCSEGKIGA